MAGDLQAETPFQEMVKNLKVDTSSAATKPNHLGRSASDATSCVSSTGDATSSSVKESEMDHETFTTPCPPTNYYGYYYPGNFDGSSLGESEDKGYYPTGDTLEIQYPVVQVDNGSMFYLMPGIQPGYSPYVSYMPVGTVGVDGQYVGQQPYSPGAMFQTPVASPGYYSPTVPYGSELMSMPYYWDPSYLVGGGYGLGYTSVPYTQGSKPIMSSPRQSRAPPSKSTPNLRSTSETKSSSSLDGGDHLKAVKGSQHGSTFPSDASMTNGHYPISKFPSYHQEKGGLNYPVTPVKTDVKGWGGAEKQLRSKAGGISDFGFLNEQNHGPRTSNLNGSLQSGNGAAGSCNPDRNGNNDSITSVVRKEQYNLPDFPTKYEQAFFFVIKSYSEDDIHKSIKYNVWASTPNGNKKLDNAFQEAQKRMGDKGIKCPVFLFFSVNASGQFCGVAEMIGRVDFSKNMDFWQQDKWNGYFPVKWHVIKDVPNPQLRHITLENNDNKPVTNCRDTQEVRFPQGTEMLNIFKNYVLKTSILDDFDFYENRQKVMQERRMRQSMPHFDMLQQKTDDITARFQSINLVASKKDESATSG